MKTSFAALWISLGISGLVSSTVNAQAHWRKAIECTHPAAGYAYLDIDQANLRSVQFVIKHPPAIEWLSVLPGYTNPSFQILDRETAIVQGGTQHPNFSPSDFHGFALSGTFGSGFGWYYGNRVALAGDVLTMEIFKNAYEWCNGSVDSYGMCHGTLERHQEEVIKNWIFRDCHSVY